MLGDLIKMRVLNRYRGLESEQFANTMGAVPAGAVIHVTPERARTLIANGNAAPIVGPSETKGAPQPGKSQDATAGEAAPSASLPVAQASPAPIATKRPRGRPPKGGRS